MPVTIGPLTIPTATPSVGARVAFAFDFIRADEAARHDTTFAALGLAADAAGSPLVPRVGTFTEYGARVAAELEARAPGVPLLDLWRPADALAAEWVRAVFPPAPEVTEAARGNSMGGTEPGSSPASELPTDGVATPSAGPA
jgi:hypothetical protein